MIRNLLAVTGLAATALASAIALQAYGGFDAAGGPPPRVRVSYAGLDLTVPEGMRILEQRINAAIDDVCPEDLGNLTSRRSVRDCRAGAIAGVEPQVRNAVAAARERERRLAYDDRPLPPPPPELPPPPPLAAEPVDAAPLRLVRRTVTTTRTVTRTRFVPAAAAAPGPSPRLKPPHRSATKAAGYARRPEVPGSWLPPSAWRAIDRAITASLAAGRLTRWSVPGRSGYVTFSGARLVGGRLCRNVRAVKYADGRQIVVAEGLRCRARG